MTNLPAQFADLEPFAKWSTSSEGERIREIETRSAEELQAFYNAVLPRLKDVIDYLNQFPLSNMPLGEMALFNLAKMMMEVATIVEHGRSIIGQYFEIERFIPLNETKG
jgi:hypothetical protein